MSKISANAESAPGYLEAFHWILRKFPKLQEFSIEWTIEPYKIYRTYEGLYLLTSEHLENVQTLGHSGNTLISATLRNILASENLETGGAA